MNWGARLLFTNIETHWAPFTNIDLLSSQHGYVITRPVKCGIKLLIPVICLPYASQCHYSDVIMASQITSITIVYTTVYSGTDQRKHQRLASLAFVRDIHRWPVSSPHKRPVTQKMFPFDEVIMKCHSVPWEHVIHTVMLIWLNRSPLGRKSFKLVRKTCHT